jgi:hypothetical protein
MVSRTNVNDASFLDDWYRNNDVRQDLTAEEAAIRDVMVDIYGITNAYIFDGLTVENGAGADTFLVNPGRCRDYLKYHIVLAAGVDNIPCLDNTGAWNYIAIQHAWAYANPDAAVKTGIAYNRQRSDHYLINVKLAPAHVEAAGWVRLARARKIGGVWEYDHEFTEGVANYGRSRTAELESWTIDFSYMGLPGAGILMNRHDMVGGPPAGPTADIFEVPFDLLVCRVSIRAMTAPPAAGTDVLLWQNGAQHGSWLAGDLTLAAGDVNAVWYDPDGGAGAGIMQYYKGDLIQVELSSAGIYPTDIVVIISGRKTGNA